MIGSWARALVGGLFAAALAWCLLRFGATQTWELYRVFLVLAPAALIACLSLRFQPPGQKRILVLLLVGAYLLAATALRSSVEGRGYLLAAIAWLSLYLCFSLASQSRERARILFLFLIGVGGLEAAYGCLQALGGVRPTSSYYGGLATGTLVNPNHFAGLVNMAIVLSLGAILALVKQRRRSHLPNTERYAQAWLVILGASWLGVAVLLSRSRGGILALVAGLSFSCWLLLLASRRAGGFGRAPALLVASVLVVTLLLGLALGLGSLFAAFEESVTVTARLEVYGATLRMLADHPLLGVGPGMYVWRFRPYQEHNLHTRYHHAHNDYLETAVEWGLPVALLLWAFVAMRLVGACRTLLSTQDAWRQGMALGCAGAIATMLLHGLIDFNLHIPSNLMTFAAILGLSWGLEPQPGPTPDHRELRIRPAVLELVLLRVLLPLLLLGAGWRVAQRHSALQLFRSAQTTSEIEAAVRRDPTAPEAALRLGTLLRDLPQERDLVRSRVSLERAVALNPHAWLYWWELARLYEQLGLDEEAERAMLEAVSRNPRKPIYRWRLGNYYLRRGDRARALPELRLALSRVSDLGLPAVALLVKSGASLHEIREAWPVGPGSVESLARLLRSRFGDRVDEAELEALVLLEQALGDEAVEPGNGETPPKHVESRR